MAPVTRSASASKNRNHDNLWDDTLPPSFRKKFLELTKHSDNAFWITTEEALKDEPVKGRVFFGGFSGSGDLEIDPAEHGYGLDGHFILWPKESRKDNITLLVPCNETQPHIVRWWQKFWDKDMKAKIIYLQDGAKKVHDIRFNKTSDGNFLNYQAELNLSQTSPRTIRFRRELQRDIWTAAMGRENSKDYQALKYHFEVDGNCFMIGTESAFKLLTDSTDAENENVFLGRFSGDRELTLTDEQLQSDKIQQGLLEASPKRHGVNMSIYIAIEETQSYHLPRGQQFWDRDMKAKIVYFRDETKKIHDIQFKRIDDFSNLKNPLARYRAELNPLYFGPHCTGITLWFRGNLER